MKRFSLDKIGIFVRKKERACVPFRGGAKGSRTPDLLNAIQTRYQLRYDPVTLLLYKKRLFIVNDFLLVFWIFLRL